MQFIQGKSFSRLVIILLALILLLVPIAAGFKILRKDSENDDIVTKVPEIITKDEIVEEIEYINPPTNSPAESVTNKQTNQVQQLRNEDNEKDDD